MAHILLVDDSPTDVHAMQTALQDAGHAVSVADSAAGGLEMARSKQPDLVLMDIVFEGMSGFQGTRKMTRDPQTKNIPVIMISGKDQETDRIWGLRQGAAEYLVKPVTPSALLDAVSKVLASDGVA